jgi:hypothetical protein
METFWRSLENSDYPQLERLVTSDLKSYYHPSAFSSTPGLTYGTSENFLTLSLSLLADDEEFTKHVQLIKGISTKYDRGFRNTQNNTPVVLILKRIIYYITNNLPEFLPECLQIFNLLTDSPSNTNIIPYLTNAIAPQSYNTILPKNTGSNAYNLLSNTGRSSTELNNSIFEYMYTHLPFYDPKLFSRYKLLLQKFLNMEGEKPLVVFHGTDHPIHTDISFTTFSFLSTTLSLNVARSYGKNIYIINVPRGFPYLNVNDRFALQILLPVGTQLRMQYSAGEIHFCEVVNTNKIQHVLSTLTCLVDHSLQQIKVETKVYENVKKYQPVPRTTINRFSPYKPRLLQGTSTLLTGMYNNTKHIIKQGPTRTPDYTLRRIYNELLATEMYRSVNLQTFQYSIVSLEETYGLASPYQEIQYIHEPDTKFARAFLSGFVYDCIFANWDVGNRGNVGITQDNQVIRTDVGGALAYRARGGFKMSFFNNSTPQEHILLLQNNFIRKCIKALQKSPEEISHILIPETLDIYMLNKLRKDIEEFSFKLEMEPYRQFVEVIQQKVDDRVRYYVSNRDIIRQSITKYLLSTQTGGAKTHKTTRVEYNKRVYIIKQTKKGKYVTIQGKRTNLKEIKGKYRYVQEGGTEDTEISDDSFGSTKVFEEFLASVPSCSIPLKS